MERTRFCARSRCGLNRAAFTGWSAQTAAVNDADALHLRVQPADNGGCSRERLSGRRTRARSGGIRRCKRAAGQRRWRILPPKTGVIIESPGFRRTMNRADEPDVADIKPAAPRADAPTRGGNAGAFDRASASPSLGMRQRLGLRRRSWKNPDAGARRAVQRDGSGTRWKKFMRC